MLSNSDSILLEEVVSLKIPLDGLKIQNYSPYDIREVFFLVRNFCKEVINHSKGKRSLNLILLSLILPYIIFFSILSITYRTSSSSTSKKSTVKSEKDTRVRQVIFKRYLHFSLLTVAYLILAPTLIILLLPSSIFAIIFYFCNSSFVKQVFRFLFGKSSEFDDNVMVVTYASIKDKDSLRLSFSVNFPKNFTFLSEILKSIDASSDFVSVNKDGLSFSFAIKCDDEFKDISSDLLGLIDFSVRKAFFALNKILESFDAIDKREVLQRVYDDVTRDYKINDISRVFINKILQVLYVNIMNLSSETVASKDFTHANLMAILANRELIANKKQTDLAQKEQILRQELTLKNFSNVDAFSSLEIQFFRNICTKEEPTLAGNHNECPKAVVKNVENLTKRFNKEFNDYYKNELEEFLKSLSSQTAIDYDKELRRILIRSNVMSYAEVINIIKSNPDFKCTSSGYKNINGETEIESYLEKKYLEIFCKRFEEGIKGIKPIFSNIFDNLEGIKTTLLNCDICYIEEYKKLFDDFRTSTVGKFHGLKVIGEVESHIEEIKILRTKYREYENLLNGCYGALKGFSGLLNKLNSSTENFNSEYSIQDILELKDSLKHLLDLYDDKGVLCPSSSYENIGSILNVVENIRRKLQEKVCHDSEESYDEPDVSKFTLMCKRLKSDLLFYKSWNEYLDNILKVVRSIPKHWTLKDYKEQITFDRTVKYYLVQLKLTDYVKNQNPDLEKIKQILLEAEYKYFSFKSLIKDPMTCLRKEGMDFLENVWPEAFKVFVQRILNNLVVDEGESLMNRSKKSIAAFLGIIGVGVNYCKNDAGIEVRTFSILRNMIVQFEIMASFFGKDLVSFFRCFLEIFQSDIDVIEEKLCPFAKGIVKNLFSVMKGIIVSPVLVAKDSQNMCESYKIDVTRIVDSNVLCSNTSQLVSKGNNGLSF